MNNWLKALSPLGLVEAVAFVEPAALVARSVGVRWLWSMIMVFLLKILCMRDLGYEADC
jgi:hypothetical protein